MRKEKVYAEGTKLPLTPGLRKTAIYQFGHLRNVDLSKYQYERHKTNYRDARADLTVFDGSGNVVFKGRDFGDRIFFWEPARGAVT